MALEAIERPFSRPISRLGFLLMHGFPLITFSAAVEPFRAANELLGEQRFSWTVYTETGRPAMSSSGISVRGAAPFSDCDDVDYVLVVAGTSQPICNLRRLNAKLRALTRRDVAVGALSGGVFVLARAGLLDGYRCSVHWYHADGFQEQFPRVIASSRLFEIDRNRFTCAGGTGSLDMMLALMSSSLSRAVRHEISRWFQHSLRSSEDEQRTSDTVRSAVLSKAIAIMNSNIEVPLSLAQVARHCGVTGRHLERLFRLEVGLTPRQYYTRQRLLRARQLVHHTLLPISEISVAVGFSSQAHFSTRFRCLFGRPPLLDRKLHIS